MLDRQKCAELVDSEWEDRRKVLAELLEYDQRGEEHPEYGYFNEYGLELSFVEPGTFEDQRAGYLRYQLSWGGPSDEIRFYQNGDIEYWYLNWFDGASIDITDDKIAQTLLEMFNEYGIDGFKLYR